MIWLPNKKLHLVSPEWALWKEAMEDRFQDRQREARALSKLHPAERLALNRQRGFIINPFRYASASNDPYFANVVSLVHFNGSNGSTTLTDQKGRTWTAHGDAQLSTSNPQYGSACGVFDGTGDYFDTPPISAYNIGTGEFCIEFSFRFPTTNPSGAYTFASQWASSGRSWVCYYSGTSARRLTMAGSTSGSSNAFLVEFGTVGLTYTAGTWYRASFSRASGSQIIAHLDGVYSGTVTGSTSLNFFNSTQPLTLAAQASGTGVPLNGALDEFRYTVGSARGRVSSNYTPDVVQFPDS